MICEEAIESPFLKRVHQKEDSFSERYGFLSETGCTLAIGRPNHAIQNALGKTPLSEIMDEADFGKVDFQGLEKQLDESFQALGTIQAFYDEGTLRESADKILKQIHFSSDD